MRLETNRQTAVSDDWNGRCGKCSLCPIWYCDFAPCWSVESLSVWTLCSVRYKLRYLLEAVPPGAAQEMPMAGLDHDLG